MSPAHDRRLRQLADIYNADSIYACRHAGRHVSMLVS
jgi:hypothetical protein